MDRKGVIYAHDAKPVQAGQKSEGKHIWFDQKNDETTQTQTERQKNEPFVNLFIVAILLGVGPGLVGYITSELARLYLWGLPPGWFILVMMILRYGGVWLAVWLYVRWVEKQNLGSIGLAFPADWWVWAGWLAAFVMAMGGLHSWAAAGSLLGYFVQGGAEEVLFRGWVLHRFRQHGPLVSTFLFVIAHVFNPNFSMMMVVGMVVYSLLMIELVKMSGGIWQAITAHALFNFLISQFQ